MLQTDATRPAAAATAAAPILIVDPDPAARDFMARTATLAGGEPCPFDRLDSDNGALDRLAADPPVQVVVLDTHALEAFGGGGALADLRRRAVRRAGLQFILVGPADELGRSLHRQPPEVTDLLPKPLDRLSFYYALREAQRRYIALDGRRQSAAGGAGGAGPGALARLSAPRRELPMELRILQALRDIDEQRLRAIGDVLEPDATWAMLSELLRARITRRRVSVTSLCLASRNPVTTALRRIDRLMRAGLITYALDPRDRRRKYIELTSEGLARVQGAVRSIGEQWTAAEGPTPGP